MISENVDKSSIEPSGNSEARSCLEDHAMIKREGDTDALLKKMWFAWVGWGKVGESGREGEGGGKSENNVWKMGDSS